MNNTIAIVGDPHVQYNNPVCRLDFYFDAILDKLQQVFNGNKYTVLLGDLFSNPVLDIQGLYRLVGLLNYYKSLGGKLYTIIGNHDIYSWNINTINKTTLGLLAKLELIEIIDANLEGALRDIKIGSYKIIPVPLNYNKNEIPKVDDEHNILIGHCFYAFDKDKKHSLEYEDLKDLGYEYIFFGHDHEYYKPKIIEKSILYRPGSLGRISSHSYNLTRNIIYYQLDIDSKEVSEVKLKVKNKEEVFTHQVIEDKENNTPEYVYDLEALMASFRERTDGTLSVRKLLEDNAEVSEEIFNFIADVHEACELPFI